jgi:hypothetical protein
VVLLLLRCCDLRLLAEISDDVETVDRGRLDHFVIHFASLGKSWQVIHNHHSHVQPTKIPSSLCTHLSILSILFP